MTDTTNWQLEESAGASPEEHLAGRHRDGWVSADERLPEFGQDVLAYCGWQITVMCVEGLGGQKMFVTEDGVNPVFGVTHWMPLPPPPKAKS